MIKKLFSGQITSITIAALLVALSSLLSRFLGIFRDRILASEFGAGDTLDIYYAAFRVPDLVFNLLVLGALSAGFVPMFTCLIKDPLCKIRTVFSKSSNREAWDLANTVICIIGAILIFLAILGWYFAPFLTKLLAPGFSLEKQALTVQLTRIMFLSPFFLGISSVFGGILQSYKRFFIYSLSPILYNIGIILGALFIVPYYGIYGLAWGVVLGAFMHLAIQVPATVGLGYRFRLSFDIGSKNIRLLAKLMVPRTLTLAISQINLLVITVIASTLSAGSLAVFNFANNLQSFPIGIFGISFAVAAFPTLSSLAFNKKELVNKFSFIIRQILFFIVPSTVLLLTLRAQITRVILGAGHFVWNDTVRTIDTLGFFTISIFAQAILPLLVRIFYARHDAKTPFLVGLVSVFANISASLYLGRIYGVAGLALAFSIASILNFVLLWIMLKIELGSLDELTILDSTIKFSAAALAAGVSVQGTKILVAVLVDMKTFVGIFTQGLLSGLVGIIVYLLFCRLLKSEEFYNFWTSLRKRLHWKKIQTGDQGEARGI